MNQTNDNGQKNGKNALEWSVFAASLLLILATVTILAIETRIWKERPPDLETRIVSTSLAEDRLTVAFEVTNRGDLAATDVLVELASTGSTPVDRSRVRIDVIPRRATRKGYVSLPGRTDTMGAEIVTVSYTEP